MSNIFSISPKMQMLCLEIMEYIEDNSDNLLENDDIISAFNTYPEPIVKLGLNLLLENMLIYKVSPLWTYSTNPLYTYPQWIKKIQNFRLSPTDRLASEFQRHSIRAPYKKPTDMNISYQEITTKDYLKFKEFYNYQILTIKPDNGYMFFDRQFGALVNDQTGEKRTHIYLATTTDNSVLGFISIANFTKDASPFTNLPYKASQIYNVNFISTRKEFENNGIATGLLTHAVQDVMKKEDLKLICYNPICEQSKTVMNKVFGNLNCKIVNKEDMPIEKAFKYGCLEGYIIQPQQQNSTSSEHSEM